jgi:peptidoglycan DL-endopeptidase CwlO
MAVKGFSAPAVGAVSAGILFLYSGITNRRLTDTLRAVLSGKNPPPSGAYPLASATGGTAGPGSPGGSTTGQAIAADALQYQGHCYSFGGAPGTSGQGCWDCSSFVNWVLGHDLGLAIPGYTTYNGASHGPTTLSYLAWGGAVTVGNSATAAQPGDLCVWQTHMGIAIGGGQMISARDPQEGTGIDSISGDVPGEVLFVRRLKAAIGGQPTLGDVQARVRGASGA